MSYKVLVVDDEAPVRDLFADLLKKEECMVKSVASGEEALLVINREDFDVVLLDIKLAGMSGLETLEKLKQTKPNLIVIMITGLGYSDELLDKCKEIGCSGYIGKNMPISQILSNFRLYVKAAQEKSRK